MPGTAWVLRSARYRPSLFSCFPYLFPINNNHDCYPLEIVKRAYAVLATHDVPAYFALLNPAVEVHQTDQLPWGGEHHGYSGVKEFVGTMQPLIDSQVDITAFIEAGDTVCAIGHTRGTARQTQQPFDCQLVHVWTVRNGLITRLEVYIDTPAMQQALGTEQAQAVH